MTEVNKLVAFSPPLRFLCLLLFPCFHAPLTESPARRRSVSVRSLVISMQFLNAFFLSAIFLSVFSTSLSQHFGRTGFQLFSSCPDRM